MVFDASSLMRGRRPSGGRLCLVSFLFFRENKRVPSHVYFVHLHLVLRELYSPIRLNPRRIDVVFVQLFVIQSSLNAR